MGTPLSAPTLKQWHHALWYVLPWERLHPHQGSCRWLSTVFTMMSCAASRCRHGMTPRRRNGERRCPPRRPPRAQIAPPPHGGRRPAPHGRRRWPTFGAYTGGAAHLSADS